MKLMKKSNGKSIKTIISVLLVAALVLSLSTLAFAEGPVNTPSYNGGSQQPPQSNSPSSNGWDNGYSDYFDFFGGYGDYYGYGDYGYDDYYDYFSYYYGEYYDIFCNEDFDIDEYLKDVEDESLKKEIKDLYEQYLEAYGNYVEAYSKYVEADDALYDAEGALMAALDKLKPSSEGKEPAENTPPQGSAPETDNDDKVPLSFKAALPGSEFDDEELAALYDEFLKWYSTQSI